MFGMKGTEITRAGCPFQEETTPVCVLLCFMWLPLQGDAC